MPATRTRYGRIVVRKVNLVSISYEGKPTPYGEIAPGATRRQNTCANATWLIADHNDEPLAHFIAGSHDARAKSRFSYTTRSRACEPESVETITSGDVC